MPTRTLRTPAIVLLCLVAGAGAGAATPTTVQKPASMPAASAVEAFRRLADEFFDTYYFPTNPTTATLAGIHRYDDRLEDYSRAAVDRQVAALKGFEKRVDAIDPKALDEQNGRHKTTWSWTKGHASHADNNRCDELATRAAREQRGGSS